MRESEKSGAGTDDIIELTLWDFAEMKFLLSQDELSASQNIIQEEDDDQEEAEDNLDDMDGNATKNTSTISVSKYSQYSCLHFMQIYVVMKPAPHY